MPTLILASKSPARAALLAAAGYVFRQVPSAVDEPAPGPNVALERYVQVLARLKAEAVAQRYPRAVVIGADTALMRGHDIIGKPDSLVDAVAMLAGLCGRTHRISSAVCIVYPGERRRSVTLVDTAHVRLRDWTLPRIRQHVALTRPLGWAGGYAVQDSYSAAIVERIEGDLATVIGLPMAKLDPMLRRISATASSCARRTRASCSARPGS